MSKKKVYSKEGRFPDPQRPHEGPDGSRQARLPGLGTGHHGGGSEAFEPENWVQRPPGGGRIAAFHSSMEMTLPAEDRPENARGVNDEDIDAQGRPMASFGSAIGLHLGSLEAAESAGSTREFIHPVAIPHENIQGPEGAPEEAKTPWKYRSAQLQKMNANDPVSTGNRWKDDAANFSPHLTDLVEQGKVIPYRNEYEDLGGTSYRGKPESLETWGEHVLATDQFTPAGGSRPSPAQVAAAQAGFEPVIQQHQEEGVDLKGRPVDKHGAQMPFQDTLFAPGDETDYNERTSHYGEEGTPEMAKWDRMVRQSHVLRRIAEDTAGRDQRNAVVERLTMIQAGRRE